MKIGFDAKRAFYNRSGLGNYSRWFINGLTNLYPENGYFLFSPKSKGRIHFSGDQSSQIITPINNKTKISQNYWRYKTMVRQINEEDLDIYHGLSHELPKGIRKCRAKSVVTMHDAIFMRYPELFDLSYRIIFKKKYAHALKVADGIIAISEQSKNDITNYFNVDQDRIKVIYQGCSSIFYNSVNDEYKEQIKLKYNLPDQFILYVGTIEPRKNLLGIFQALVAANVDVPLVAVGRPTNYLNKVKDFVSEHKLEKQAIFLHNVETPELPAIYQMASLFVYPSLFEGFGIPILEALNSGTPVITSKGSCFPEVGGDAAKYAEYGNIEELADTIKTVLQSKELQLDMATKGKAKALEFREEKIIGELFNYYQSLIS